MGRTVAARQSAITFADHIRELRTRFFIVAAVFLLASCLAYAFRAPILHLLLSPLHGEKLVYLNPAGGFNFIFLISIYSGLALSIPILIQQLYGFLKPALPKRVQHYAGRLFIISLLLLLAGIAFGYYLAIPGALHFLYSFANDYVTASLTADSYLNFIIAYTIGLGIVFQLPLLVLFFHWIKPLTPGGLMKSERWVVLLAFIAAAIITPTPDPLNQTIIALPVILVYQLGVIMVLVAIAKQRKQARRMAAAKRQFAATQAGIKSPNQVPRPLVSAATGASATMPTYRRSVDGFVMVVSRPSLPKRQPAPALTTPQAARQVVRSDKPAPYQRPQSIDGMLVIA